MEYMDGGALTEVISICQISESQIACICKEVKYHDIFLFYFLILDINLYIFQDIKSY